MTEAIQAQLLESGFNEVEFTLLDRLLKNFERQERGFTLAAGMAQMDHLQLQFQLQLQFEEKGKKKEKKNENENEKEKKKKKEKGDPLTKMDSDNGALAQDVIKKMSQIISKAPEVVLFNSTARQLMYNAFDPSAKFTNEIMVELAPQKGLKPFYFHQAASLRKRFVDLLNREFGKSNMVSFTDEKTGTELFRCNDYLVSLSTYQPFGVQGGIPIKIYISFPGAKRKREGEEEESEEEEENAEDQDEEEEENEQNDDHRKEKKQKQCDEKNDASMILSFEDEELEEKEKEDEWNKKRKRKKRKKRKRKKSKKKKNRC